MLDQFAYGTVAAWGGGYIVCALAEFFDCVCNGDTKSCAFDKRQIEEISDAVQALSVRAARQLEDLRINQALTGLELSHPVLRERQRHEAKFIQEVGALTSRNTLLQWSAAQAQ